MSKTTMETFEQRSYKRHTDNYSEDGNKQKLESWRRKDTVDAWRHQRMYKNLDPLIESFKDASWLTVGDGRYGTDANYLISKGAKKVLASDISDACLTLAKADGFISDYVVMNAEHMNLESESYDFVVCKESFHHFPRPFIALYEMLRVAKKGVALIEPQDPNIYTPGKDDFRRFARTPMQALRDIVKGRSRRSVPYDFGGFEPVGNFIYSLSKREIEKVALGLNLPAVAFNELNDAYEDGVEFEPAVDGNEKFERIKSLIARQDKKVSKGRRKFGLLVSIVLKEKIKPELLQVLKKSFFDVVDLPSNPYA